MKDNNLHLEFKFTDRGGRDVFEIFPADDNKRMRKPLGFIRMMPQGLMTTNTARVEWNGGPAAKRETIADLDPLEQGESLTCDLCDGSGRVQIKPLEKHRSTYFIDCPACQKETRHGTG